MAYVPTTGLAGKVAKRKASALAGPEMTQKEVMAENPNISATARLQQAGRGGAMKEGTEVLDNSPKGRIAGNPTGIEWKGGSMSANNGKTASLGASIATPNATTPGVGATSGLQPIQTPGTPTSAIGATPTGGVAPSPSIGGALPTASGLQPKPTPPGQDYVLGLDELDETQRTVYDSLSPIEKKAFEAIAKNDYAAKADYLEKANSRIESAKKMEDMKVQSTALNNEQAAENSKIQIQQAREKIDGMKRRISYLGSRGQPGVSQAGIENVNQEVTRAEGILDKMYKSDSRLQQGQQIGVNYEAEAFSRQLKEITDDLDQKVGKEFQSAYNTFTKAVLDGKFDTPEDVENFREQLYASLDAQILGATDANLQQMQFLVERGDKLAEDMTNRQESEAKSKAEQEKMSNTVNKDMSEALGYYVNGLGEPIMNTQGQPIPIPEEPVMDPVFDKDTGTLITFSEENGRIVGTPQQILQGKQEPWSLNSTTGEYYRTNAGGQLEVKGGRTSNGIPTASGYTIQKDPATGNITPQSTQSIIDSCLNIKGRSNMQCGTFANAYIESITGKYGSVSNSFDSKVAQIDEIGRSNAPVPGGLFAFKGGGKEGYGHIGVVTAINADGSIQVVEANRTGTGAGDGTPPTVGTYANTNGFVFSQPPQKSQPLTDKQFTQSNQVITSFKSDPTVKAFEEAYTQGVSLLSSLNDKSGPGDVAAIFQFMKALDPASTVREGEFALAAKSAGVAQYLGNTFERLSKGKKLTDTQREAFGKLATQFIKDKSKLYETKYEDGMRRLEQQGIDTSVFPTNIAKELDRTLVGGSSTQYKEGGVYTSPKDNKKYKFVGGKRYVQQ